MGKRGTEEIHLTTFWQEIMDGKDQEYIEMRVFVHQVDDSCYLAAVATACSGCWGGMRRVAPCYHGIMINQTWRGGEEGHVAIQYIWTARSWIHPLPFIAAALLDLIRRFVRLCGWIFNVCNAEVSIWALDECVAVSDKFHSWYLHRRLLLTNVNRK